MTVDPDGLALVVVGSAVIGYCLGFMAGYLSNKR